MRRKRRPNRPSQESESGRQRKPASASPISRYLSLAVAAFVLTGVLVLAVQFQRRPSPRVAEFEVPATATGKRVADALLARVETLADRGELDRAEALLDELRQIDPDNGTAWLYRGHLASQQGKLEAALAAWREVPDQPAERGGTARFLEATILLRQNAARQAESKLLQSTSLNPTYLQPRERLLTLYVLQLRRAATLRLLQQIQQLRRLSLDELVLRSTAGEQITEVDQAVGILTAFADSDPLDGHSRAALVKYLLLAERPAEIGKWLAELQPLASGDDDLLATCLEAHLALGQPQEAVGLLAGHGPDERWPASLWRQAGEIAEREGDFGRAAECWGRVVQRDPTDRQAHYRAGLLLGRLGRTENSQALLARAALLDQLRLQVMLAARADRRKLGLLLPVLSNVGDLLLKLEQPTDAAGWYQLALSLHAGDERAQSGLQQVAAARARPSRPTDQPAGPPLAGGPPVQTADPPLDHTGTDVRLPDPSKEWPGADRRQPATADGRMAQIRLRDVHEQVGLQFQYFNGRTKFKYLIEAMGGGVAVLDYDADGWPDLHFPQGCPLPVDLQNNDYSDRLFRNVDGKTVIDVTAAAGLHQFAYGQGAVAADFDNDGFVDLIVANFGRNTAFHNNGDGTFTDVTDRMGMQLARMSSSLGVLDLDRDGDLDLYVVNYVDSLKVCRNAAGEFSTCRPESFDGEQDELYLNRGDGRFEDGTQDGGIGVPNGKGLGVVTADLDGDGWTDIYVANDTTPNFLFVNQFADRLEQGPAGPAFREIGLASGAAMSGEGRAEAGMGIACADLNGDSHLDLFVTNYFNETNTAYFNYGDAFFEDVSRARGLANASLPMVGFGTQTVDFDLDGWPDLLVANGHIDDFGDPAQAWKMPPQLFRNGGQGDFREVSGTAGDYFAGKYLGRGVARLDWNRDGRPDVVVVHQDANVALLENQTLDTGQGVVLRLQGVQSNRDAVGARVQLTAGGRTQRFEVCGGDGFYASNERRQFIGLGTATTIEQLKITWPSGQVDTWHELPVNCELIAIEGQRPRVSTLGNPPGVR